MPISSSHAGGTGIDIGSAGSMQACKAIIGRICVLLQKRKPSPSGICKDIASHLELLAE